MKIGFLLVGLFFGLNAIAQERLDDRFDPNQVDSAEFANSEFDSLEFDYSVKLSEAKVYGVVLKTELEKKYYVWLRRRVREVWPYVRIAATEYNAVNDSLEKITSKRKRRKFVKQKQKLLAEKLEDKLKKLSTSRGQILVKLIHRETDVTAYQMVKGLRGGFNAFLWNSLGGAYNINLKEEFNPDKTREDLYIEVILQRDFASGRLKPLEE